MKARMTMSYATFKKDAVVSFVEKGSDWIRTKKGTYIPLDFVEILSEIEVDALGE
jgi:hypothetical protein